MLLSWLQEGRLLVRKPFEDPNNAIPILFGVECNVHYPFLGNKVKTKAIAQLHYSSEVYKVLHSLLHWHILYGCIVSFVAPCVTYTHTSSLGDICISLKAASFHPATIMCNTNAHLSKLHSFPILILFCCSWSLEIRFGFFGNRLVLHSSLWAPLRHQSCATK